MHANSYCFTVVRLVSGSPPPVGLDPCGFLCMIFGQGWTIRKVMGVGGGGGGGEEWGIFSLQEFCILLSACAGMFFSVDTLCTIFFFFCCCCFCFPEKKKTLNKGFFKKSTVVLSGLGMITFNP